MKHYDFGRKLRKLLEDATVQYEDGQRGADTFFSDEDREWLAGNGITPQHLYDYAEDQNGYGEPGFENAIAIESIRRDYFLNVQNGKPSSIVLDQAKMPAKADSIRDIPWLPRLIPKARAKLRGELPPSLMYCCGGDRTFFQTHNIFPSEFLTLVWRSGDNDSAIVDWVVRRSAAK